MSERERNKQKLNVLKELLEEKVINEEEYEKRKNAILDEIVEESCETQSIQGDTREKTDYKDRTFFNDFDNSQSFQSTWDDSLLKDNNNKKNSIIINSFFSLILLIACIFVLSQIFLIAPKDNEAIVSQEDAVTSENIEKIEKTKLSGEEAQKMVLEGFASPDVREQISISGEEEPSVEIDGEMYYQTEMREYGGHLMGIYYVHEYGERIYLMDYFRDFLHLVRGKITDGYENVVSEKEALTLLKDNIATMIDTETLSIILLDNTFYYCIKEAYSEVYYCLEMDGSKIWELDYWDEKSIYLVLK